MTHELKLAEMMCTRLCHDLTGPISAVNNGAEFLSDEGFEMQGEALDLILNSATEAVHRLQFFRQAYGRINEHGEADLGEKRGIAKDFFSSTKVTLDWPDNHAVTTEVSVSQKMSRLILNTMIIAGASLIRGGTLSVRVNAVNGGKKQMTVKAVGDSIKLDADLQTILERPEALTDLTPKTAQAYMTLKIASELDMKIILTKTDKELQLQATQL